MFNATETYKQRLIARIKELIKERGRGITRLEGAYLQVIAVIESNDIEPVVTEPHKVKVCK